MAGAAGTAARTARGAATAARIATETPPYTKKLLDKNGRTDYISAECIKIMFNF